MEDKHSFCALPPLKPSSILTSSTDSASLISFFVPQRGTLTSVMKRALLHNTPPPPNSPPRDKDLDLLQVHSELGVSSSFHVISGTLPVMATPNAGLCSSTGQRIHECFISCCARMFVYQRSSLIPTKLDFFLFHRPSETIHTLWQMLFW